MKLPWPAPDAAAAALHRRLTERPWRLLVSGPGAAAWNMAVDVAMLQAAATGAVPPTLRFYSWKPSAVSLGRFQPVEQVRRDYLERRGWDLVRRPTGGRAVLHHLELTYSVVVPPSLLGGAGVRTSYCVLSAALRRGVRELLGEAAETGCASRPASRPASVRGVANCFALAGEGDTLVPEGKLVGSAQVRRDGALLQHGSLLLDAEPEAWEALFGSAGQIATLGRLLGAPPDSDAASAALRRGFESLGFRFEPGPLTPNECDAAGALRDTLRIDPA